MPKKNRNRQYLDTDPEIQAMIKQLAKELGVPQSQVWNYFAAEGLLDFQEETSGIWSRLTGSKSIRYKHNIDYDDILDKLRPDDYD